MISFLFLCKRGTIYLFWHRSTTFSKTKKLAWGWCSHVNPGTCTVPFIFLAIYTYVVSYSLAPSRFSYLCNLLENYSVQPELGLSYMSHFLSYNPMIKQKKITQFPHPHTWCGWRNYSHWSFCILTVGRFPCRQNTFIGTDGYSQRRWSRDNFPTDWLYTSWSIDRLVYNQPTHTRIELWLVPAELAKFQSMYGWLKGAIPEHNHLPGAQGLLLKGQEKACTNRRSVRPKNKIVQINLLVYAKNNAFQMSEKTLPSIMSSVKIAIDGLN